METESRSDSTGEVAPDVVLKVVDLCRDFKMGKMTVQALKSVSFEVQRGEFVSIMGKSGSGKTTLLNILGTLDTPTAGEVFIDGKPISKMNDTQRTAIRRERIGFVFQNYNLLPILNAVENVELPLFNASLSKDERHQRAMDMLEIVDLQDRATHKPEEMSGGQCQRVTIARALVTNPAIVLADEPTGALDSKTGNDIINLFERLNAEQGYTFVLVTHDVATGNRARRKIVLKDGQVESDSQQDSQD